MTKGRSLIAGLMLFLLAANYVRLTLRSVTTTSRRVAVRHQVETYNYTQVNTSGSKLDDNIVTLVPIDDGEISYMVSAFWDNRPLLLNESPLIRILIAKGEQFDVLRYECLLADRNFTVLEKPRNLTIEVVQDFHAQYVAAIVSCPVSATAGDTVVTLQLKSDVAGRVERWIPVNLMPGHPYPPLDVELSNVTSMAVCTSPLRGTIYDYSIKSWLEYYQMVGF